MFPFGGSNGGRSPKPCRLPSLGPPQLSESGKGGILPLSVGKSGKVPTPQTVKKQRARGAPVPGTATARAQGTRASRAASVGGLTKRRGSPAGQLYRASRTTAADVRCNRQLEADPAARRGRAQRRAHRMMALCPFRRPTLQAVSHQARIVDARAGRPRPNDRVPYNGSLPQGRTRNAFSRRTDNPRN